MAKNKDSKTVNRTGTLDFESMQITKEDKDGIQIFDVKELLKSFDGNSISLTVASEFEPEFLVEEE